MKEHLIIRRHLLGGAEGGAWGGFIFSLHLLFQFGGYLRGYLILMFWSVVLGGIIGILIGARNVKCSTPLGHIGRAMMGAGTLLLVVALLWLTSSDDGAVTPATWPEALFNLAEVVVLLGALPGVMAGLEKRKAA